MGNQPSSGSLLSNVKKGKLTEIQDFCQRNHPLNPYLAVKIARSSIEHQQPQILKYMLTNYYEDIKMNLTQMLTLAQQNEDLETIQLLIQYS